MEVTLSNTGYFCCCSGIGVFPLLQCESLPRRVLHKLLQHDSFPQPQFGVKGAGSNPFPNPAGRAGFGTSFAGFGTTFTGFRTSFAGFRSSCRAAPEAEGPQPPLLEAFGGSAASAGSPAQALRRALAGRAVSSLGSVIHGGPRGAAG